MSFSSSTCIKALKMLVWGEVVRSLMIREEEKKD